VLVKNKIITLKWINLQVLQLLQNKINERQNYDFNHVYLQQAKLKNDKIYC